MSSNVPVISSRYAGAFRLHLRLEEVLQQREVLDDRIDLIAVEGECLFEFVEDADEIQHEAVRLHHLRRLVLVRPVHARYGLQQRVIAHRLIEIHRIEDRRVEPRKQLFRDDENFRPLADLGKALADLLLALCHRGATS